MKSRGFTMLELVVMMAITSIAFLILGGIFITQGRYLAIQNAVSDTQYAAFQVLDTIGLYTSSASAVVASQTINGRAYTSGTSTVILKLPSIDSSGAIISNSYDYVAFGLFQNDPTKFMFDIDSATNSVRQNNQYIKAALVDKLIFRYNAVTLTNTDTIEVYVRASKSARGQVIRQPLGRIYYLGSS